MSGHHSTQQLIPSDSSPALYVGIMSGTSLDGVDAVLVDFSSQPMQLVGHAYRAYDAPLKAELFALNQAGKTDELHHASLAAIEVARLYAQTTADLLMAAGIDAARVVAIGAHGQTIRHAPQLGYSLQLNAPAYLVEQSGITVVADFRSRDIAAGGQGAPLVPAFHEALLGRRHAWRAALNVGGIANITLLPPDHDAPVIGFDAGPGNMLMDYWCAQHKGQAFDYRGQWAASGQVDAGLLKIMLDDPYFARAYPKSTGRDDFHPQWLAHALDRVQASIAPADVQATLAELTVKSIVQQIVATLNGAPLIELVLCGGGALNDYLVGRLVQCLPHTKVCATTAYGLDPQHVEAAAFAWMAKECLEGKSANLPSVTGAKGRRILGAIYAR